MEGLFRLDTVHFIEEMEMLQPEAFEAFGGYLVSDRIPDDLTLCTCLLKVVYTFVKTRTKHDWKTMVLIRYLYEIALTGEILYMKTGENHEEISMIRDSMDKEMQIVVNMAVLAGMILEYYYRVFEKKNHSNTYGNGIIEAMTRLMTVDTTVVDRMKVVADEGKPLPILIKEDLDSKMTGQDEAKKIVSMALYRFMRYGERNVVMLEGPTGSGKTFLFENLSTCEYLTGELTFYSYPATQLTPNGYSGDNVENMLQGYKDVCEQQYYRSGRKTEKSYKGVIFIDEMDKLFLPNTNASGEDTNQTILSQLLTVIAGTACIAGIDTRDIAFILAGAFENIENIRESRKKKTKMGFTSQKTSSDTESDKYDLRQELLKTGAPRQFVARISHFVHMETIDRDRMRQILINPENGIFTDVAATYRKDGLIIELENDDVIEKMLDRIMEKKAGVRGVRETLADMIHSYDYDMLKNGYQIMVIHKGVLDGELPRFVKTGSKNESIVRFNKRNGS